MVIKAVMVTEKEEYVTLSLAGEKKSLVITGELYSALGRPGAGYDVSEREYLQICEDDEYYRATLRALNILSFGDNSRRKLYEKLRQRGVLAAVAERVVDNMCELGYINEQRQLERIASDLANHSLFGPLRISAKLINSGYGASDVRRAIEKLCESGEVDFDENFARLVRRTLGEDSDLQEVNKIKYKYGYKR